MKNKQVLCVTLLIFAWAGSACTSWRAYPETPADILLLRKPGRVRVHLSDGAQVQLRNPAVVGDSLVGNAGRHRIQLRLPVADIEHLSLARTNWLLISLVGLAAIPVAGIAHFMIYCSAHGCT